jgi:hypothetical protein
MFYLSTKIFSFRKHTYSTLKTLQSIYISLYDGISSKSHNSSEVDIEVSHLVGALKRKPNWAEHFIIGAGIQLTADIAGQPRFYIDKPVDFSFSSSYNPTTVVVESIDSNGEPDEFRLTKTVKAYSGDSSNTYRNRYCS